MQHQIAEQKKMDSALSGVTPLSSDIVTSPSSSTVKEGTSNSDVQLILPGDGTSIKKQRKTTKQLFFERGTHICSMVLGTDLYLTCNFSL